MTYKSDTIKSIGKSGEMKIYEIERKITLDDLYISEILMRRLSDGTAEARIEDIKFSGINFFDEGFQLYRGKPGNRYKLIAARLFPYETEATVSFEIVSNAVPLENIFIPQTESLCLHSALAFSWEQADLLIKAMAMSAPDDGTYDKVYYRVQWIDGSTWENRMDLTRNGNHSIKEEIRRTCKFHSGLYRPEHFTQESYDLMLKENEERKQKMLHILEHYIGGEGENK